MMKKIQILFVAFITTFSIIGSVSADSPPTLSSKDKSVSDMEQMLLQLIDKFYTTQEHSHFKDILFFNSKVEENEFDRLMSGYVMDGGSSLINNIHFVEGPANFQSGEYLFLVPTKKGYMPKIFEIVNYKKKFYILYQKSFFDDENYSSELFLSTVEKIKRDLEKKSILWKSLEGAALAKQVRVLKKDLENQLKGINYALKNDLLIVKSYGDGAARKERLQKFSSLSDIEIKKEILKESALLLKSISLGRKAKENNVYQSMVGITLDLEGVTVCNQDGAQKHNWKLKEKFNENSTVLDIINTLGPGYVPQMSGTGSITWFFDDGSQISTHFWPENLASKVVLKFE